MNRSKRAGMRLFCNRTCSGLARRKTRTKDELVARKAEYDREYRAKNQAELKAKKKARHLATYDSERERIKRKAKMPRHVEYCQRPEYREWKKAYDRRYRCKITYGPFWEAASIALDLEEEIHTRASDYEIRVANGTLNKALQRRRTDGRS